MKFGYSFFEEEIMIMRQYGLVDGESLYLELSNDELDKLYWKAAYLSKSAYLFGDRKKFRLLANRIRLLVDPDFITSHPLVGQ